MSNSIGHSKPMFLREKFKVTEREYECLTLWASGYTLKTIACRLNISPRTVETHINKVKRKTGSYYKDKLIELFHETH